MSEVTVKKYVVRLSKNERSVLEDLISKGKHPAATILKARVLLKADVSDAGEGWSDSRIVKALDTSVATVARIRQRLVEDGLDAVLTRKHSPNSARKRVFDGAAEAKLIALACSEPPKGRSRWTLALLEDKVVELKIVERASDNTIGRVLKKRSQTTSERSMGHPARRQRRVRRRHGGGAGRVSPPARSGVSIGLPGRDLQTVDQGNARADPPGFYHHPHAIAPTDVSCVLAGMGMLSPRESPAHRNEGHALRSKLHGAFEGAIGAANAPYRRPEFPDGAPADDQGAFNAHSPGGGSGLAQPVFRSPARSPTWVPPRRGSCAAPPSERRSTLSYGKFLDEGQG